MADGLDGSALRILYLVPGINRSLVETSPNRFLFTKVALISGDGRETGFTRIYKVAFVDA